jgi:hypothetical protein
MNVIRGGLSQGAHEQLVDVDVGGSRHHPPNAFRAAYRQEDQVPDFEYLHERPIRVSRGRCHLFRASYPLLSEIRPWLPETH